MLAYGIEVEPAAPYGVAVEAALDDLRAAAAEGRDVSAPLLRAERAGCTPREIEQALAEAHATA